MVDVTPAAGGVFPPGSGGVPQAGGGATPPPAANGSANGSANGNGAWSFPKDKAFAEYLPETYKADPVFKDIKDFDGLLKTFVNGQKMIGADKATILQLPKDGDEKGWADFHARLGRPETPDKYKVPARADGKAYSDTDAAFHKQILPILHKAGMTQKMVEQVVPQWNAIVEGIAGEQNKTIQADMEKAGAALKEKWGAAYDDKLKLADNALRHYTESLKLGDGLTRALESTKLGNSPELAELFAHLGKQLSEDGIVGKGQGGYSGALSPAEAKQQIAAKERDPDFMKQYRSKSVAGHQEAVDAMKALYESAYPSA